MKRWFACLTLPSLVCAFQFSGEVHDLDNRPLAGVNIQYGGQSVLSAADGSWSLSGSDGLVPRSPEGSTESSRLQLQNGHLVWRGADHSIEGRLAAPPVRGSKAKVSSLSRAQSAYDMITAWWNGKRLVVVPVGTVDSSSIALSLDTSWQQDHGVPWNPRIPYGTLRDDRNGAVYRTVRIGQQNWMAENLNLKVDSSWCYENNPGNCEIYGRLYSWTAVMALAETYDVGIWGGDGAHHQGVCPAGWRVPSDSDWTYLAAGIGIRRGLGDSVRFDTADGFELKSSSGWIVQSGGDKYGFRALPAGEYHHPLSDGLSTSLVFENQGWEGFFWTTAELDFWHGFIRFLSNGGGYLYRPNVGGIKREGYSLRCIQGT